MATSTTTSTTTAVTTQDMKSRLLLSMPRIPPKVYLKTVNPHITCNLCKGYLIDATTIVECLHSFCHSCIMMHLRCEDYCPSCDMLINKAKPNIKPDATLQAIVYKLVPGLYEKELLRRRAFYKLRTKEAQEATPEQRGDDTEHLIFGPNESISLMLEYSDNDNAPQTSDDENSNSSHEINSSEHCDDDFEVQLRKPKYLQCPAIFTISNLKKFLLHKFSINPNKFCVEVMYKVKSIALPDHYTLMDVAYIFTWKRDAPMKFLYCVRAAHSPVANIEQSAVMYDLPPSRFQTNSQLASASDSTDQDQDQSSDADSEVRSERTKQPEINGTRTSPLEPINSTSDERRGVPSSSTLQSASSTVTSTSLASTSSKLNSSVHISINGSESKKMDSLDMAKKEPASSPTISSRLESTAATKTERLSSSPDKQQTDRRSNGASPKLTTSKARNIPDVKASVSPSRTNQDLKDSKEKVKTKPILLDSSARAAESSNRTEHKTVTFSDKPSPSNRLELKPILGSKGRLLFNRDEKAKSLSPPLSAENEYDFEQHLQKEKLLEKNKRKEEFLSSIHLTPCTPSTDSPLVQLPKMPKTEQKPDAPLATNLSKDKESKPSLASNRPSVSSSSGNADKQLIKKPENKTSKRKSREPVKNIAKVKSVSPIDRMIDTKWDPVKSTIVTSVSPSSPVSTASTSQPSSSSAGDRLRKVLQQGSANAAAVRIFNAMVQQSKNHLKPIQSSSSNSKSNQTLSSASSSKPVFKTPGPTSSKESSLLPSGLKQPQPSTSESETSIIINNVQRPNQADTPRPSMSFKPNLSQPPPFFYSPNLNRNFSNETEIQEIRNDDLSNLKVYGPAMNLAKPFNSPLPAPANFFGLTQLYNQINKESFAKMPNLISTFPQLHSNLPLLEVLKRPKKAALDTKKAGTSSSYDAKLNTLQKQLVPLRGVDLSDSTKQQNVQSLLTSCKIPPSLSITLTSDESESVSRSPFNTKTNDVVNSIEIVRLHESNNEQNAKFPSPSSSWQTNKNLTNQMKLLASQQQNNQIDSTSLVSDSYQEQFLQSLRAENASLKNQKKLKLQPPKQHPIRPNDGQEAQKRKLQPADDKTAKVRKLQPNVPPKKASPTQRPVPDLLIPKDDLKLASSGSSQASPSNATNNKSDRQSPTVSSNVPSLDKANALTLAVAQAKVQPNEMATKFQPLQTSAKPIWAKHCTPDQMASHKALMENLAQSKKNSFVD